jgi:hypothetical protein
MATPFGIGYNGVGQAGLVPVALPHFDRPVGRARQDQRIRRDRHAPHGRLMPRERRRNSVVGPNFCLHPAVRSPTYATVPCHAEAERRRCGVSGGAVRHGRRTVLSHDAVRSCPLGRAATSQTVSEWPCVMGEAEWRRPLGARRTPHVTADKRKKVPTLAVLSFEPEMTAPSGNAAHGATGRVRRKPASLKLEREKKCGRIQMRRSGRLSALTHPTKC